MDGALVLQYRVLLVLVAAGLAFGLLVSLVHSRTTAGSSEPRGAGGDSPAPLAGGPESLSAAMLLLTTLAVGAGALIALPAVIILPFFDSWRVLVLVLAAVLMLAAPLIYAWRTRPF